MTNCAICSSENTCSSCISGYYVLSPKNTSCVTCTGVGQQKIASSPKMCVYCLPNCEECESVNTCKVCEKKYHLSSPTSCSSQKNLTAFISSTDDPQTFLLHFSDSWIVLVEKLNTIFSLEISDLETNQYSYNIAYDNTTNTLTLYLMFKKYVNGDNILSIKLNVMDSDRDEFILENKLFEQSLSDYCPLPTTYVSSKTNRFIFIDFFNCISSF